MDILCLSKYRSAVNLAVNKVTSFYKDNSLKVEWGTLGVGSKASEYFVSITGKEQLRNAVLSLLRARGESKYALTFIDDGVSLINKAITSYTVIVKDSTDISTNVLYSENLFDLVTASEQMTRKQILQCLSSLGARCTGSVDTFVLSAESISEVGERLLSIRVLFDDIRSAKLFLHEISSGDKFIFKNMFDPHVYSLCTPTMDSQGYFVMGYSPIE